MQKVILGGLIVILRNSPYIESTEMEATEY